MANEFSKQEKAAFDQLLEGYNDQLVISAAVNKFNFGDVEAERSNDQVWRPMPYIATSGDGMTATWGDTDQLSVPASINFQKWSTFQLNARELRDGLQDSRQVTAAQQKLASDVNVALMNTASNEGTVVVARTAAATGFDDVAEADAAFNEQGIPMNDRYMALATRSYNSMAGNLAARATINEKPTRAFEKAYVGDVAGFETLKLDYANRITAAAGVGVTVNGAGQDHTPVATTDLANGGKGNVDNRVQDLILAVTSGAIAVGDCFTIAGVNSVHHITKQDTGQLKTFRIMAGTGGSGTFSISPAIVADGAYQNVTAAPANGAALTFLNTTAAAINPFWTKESIELLPARLVMPSNSGMASMSATTDQGITVLMTRQGSITDLNVKYRLDVMFGTVALNREMMGIELFSQA